MGHFLWKAVIHSYIAVIASDIMTVLSESIDLFLLQLRIIIYAGKLHILCFIILPYLVNIRFIIQSRYKRVFNFSSKITPTCFVNHKIGNIALIYKSIKTVHFNVTLVPNKNFRTMAQTVFPVGVSTNW